MLNKGKWLLFFIPLLFLFLQPGMTSAHSALLEAFPSINSHVDQAPSEIRLKFNERLEKDLYYIFVFDEKGKSVTEKGTEMSQDQREIHIDLPHLPDGNYTISYQVISGDGHPISQAYLLSIGNNDDQIDSFRYVYDGNHTGPFFWLIKASYYFSFLTLCGLIMWKYLYPIRLQNGQELYETWFKHTRRLYLLFLILVGFIQFSNVWEEFGIEEVPVAFFQTIFGLAWCTSLVLTILGIFLIGKRKWFDLLIVLILLAAEGLTGHAVTFHPIALSVILDIVHLTAASIWLGGLLYLLFVWKDSNGRSNYLHTLSKFSFWSIVTLIVTGIILAFIFLPTPSFLFHTEWGYLILAKSIFVLCVIGVATKIRKRIAQGAEKKLKSWIKWDYRLLAIIVFIVGILTDASPIPSNDPLIWRASQAALSMDMEITPNNPGVQNTFNISVTMPKGKKVKDVELKLVYLGEQNIAPLTVPLQYISHSDPKINRYSYTCVGPFLSLPGTWAIEVDISDQEDNWTEFKKEMTIYPVQKK